MKFIFTLLIAITFNLSAQAQEPETLGKPVDEMTLLGNEHGKPVQVEDKKTKRSILQRKKA
ncbi:MAG: hypothetical protein AAGB31_16325 [Bdellovibrio sp.]